MKSKLLLTLGGVFFFFGLAGIADLFGMGDIAGYLKNQGDVIKAEYRAVDTGNTLTETTVITTETKTSE